MIGKALEFTYDVLDQYLKNRLGLDESRLSLNGLVDVQGAPPQANQNKLVLSLINVEKETARPYYMRQEKLPGGQYANVSLSCRFNLDVMISASFDDYREALKFLDAGILFFQINASIDGSTSSAIPAGLSRLEFEVEKISYHQMHSLWTAMGAKYQPSVIYKMRIITIQGGDAGSFTPAISQTSNQATV